ncbi:DUF3152 domain-containing protein [Streptomyces sp. NPDC101393]|uniref:DUF3152 domain-containing protein n=1 Tax=Streptomyces sp. NPDC101393 TaxID=3366141 RepID=UPI0038262051
MGRHSRRGRPENPADTSGGAPGPLGPPTAPAAPAGSDSLAAPGQGSRRRGPGADDDLFGDGVRGGHPEQREPGGGWGAHRPSPAFPASPSAPAQGGPRVPRPRAAEPDGRGAAGFGPAGGAGRPGAGGANGPSSDGSSYPAGPGVLRSPMSSPGGGVPGPRREYVEAFSDTVPGGDPYADDDVFRAGAPGGTADGVPAGGRNTGRSVVFDRAEIDELDRQDGLHTEGAERGGPAGGDPDGPAGEGAAGDGRRKGAKGRTFTGAAAAAVTTVLAVVIAGQVAERHKDGEPQARSGPDRADGVDDEASRSQARPTQDAKPAGYAQKMAKAFPLDAELTASGRFKATGGDAAAPGRGHVVRYRVDVEEGLPLDGDLFADAVHKTLNDKRSWAHGGERTFQRVGSGDADFVISLASPGTTAKWCAKSGLDTTEDNVSCDSAATDRVMINAYRWAQGAETYGHDKMYAYRQMLINHEVGHRLGHNHTICSKQGALAPVMMQQTKFLTTDGATCRPNAWPFPTAG